MSKLTRKVTFIIGALGGGGAERVAVMLANEMKNQGYLIDILVFNDLQESYENKCNVHFLGIHDRFSMIFAIRKKLLALHPDTVIAFEYHIAMKSILAAKGLSLRMIISERNDPHKIDGRFFLKRLRNYLYHQADMIVFQTKEAQQAFNMKIHKHSVVIMNHVKENLPVWNQESHFETIITFCRLEKQKNIFLLIDAFERVHCLYSNYVLEIYGNGSLKNILEEYIKDKELTGCVNIYPFTKNIHAIASHAAMFVSSSDYEGVSNSMLEAMAMGMPVICTDCPIGGAKMVIDNGKNGLLVPVRNADKMSDAIVKLISDKSYACKLGRNALKIREQLDIQKIVREWIDII